MCQCVCGSGKINVHNIKENMNFNLYCVYIVHILLNKVFNDIYTILEHTAFCVCVCWGGSLEANPNMDTTFLLLISSFTFPQTFSSSLQIALSL